MWLPVAVPCVFDPFQNVYDNRSLRALTPVIPFEQRVYRAVNETVVLQNYLYASQGFPNASSYAEDERKLKVKSSLFNLLRVNHSLELTDPKLLGWYLSLPVEERTLVQQEGGLLQFIQKHPDLIVVREHVYLRKGFTGNYGLPPTTMSSNKSRCPTLPGVSRCQTCGNIIQFGTKKCHGCGAHVLLSDQDDCVSEHNKDLELLPHYMMEVTSKNETSPQRYRSLCNGSDNAQAQCLSQIWQEMEQSDDIKHFNDLTAQANHSLDVELDMQSQAHRVNGFNNNEDKMYEIPEVGAHFCDVDEEILPEYYSFNRTSLNNTEWSDDSQHMQSGFTDSIMATKGSTDLADITSETTMASDDDCFSCVSKSFELASDSGGNLKDLRKKEPPKSFVNQIVDASGDFRACFTSTRATEVCQVLQTKAGRNVATDTDSLPVSNKKDTQIQKSTSDKSTVTEIYITDLDILTEEFIKLKEMEKELKQLKAIKSRPIPDGDHCRHVEGFDCAERVRRAELRLLSLQYIMCQQHCWRRHFNSPLGESAYQGTDALPDILTETLNALEKDYHNMMRQILAGTPLDDLKPLSVDSQKLMTTGTNYNPTSVLEAHLGSLDCLGSIVANRQTLDGKDKGMRTPLCQNTEDIPDEEKVDSSNSSKTAVLSDMQDWNSSVIKDPNCSEAWFDAEEELKDGNVEKQEGRDGIVHKMDQKGADEDNSNHTSLLCVTCLPRTVTEKEMLIWFEKYNATGISISTSSNNIRVAIVYLKSHNDAKAAVKDLNGITIQGNALCVQQLCVPTSTHPQSTAGTSKSIEKHQLTMKGASSKAPCCSVDRLTKVSDLPTASGTCVPQRYADKGSFNTILVRLLERHPDVDRQIIVDAMLKLRDKNKGILRGFTLSAIVDMTSMLITKNFKSKCV